MPVQQPKDHLIKPAAHEHHHKTRLTALSLFSGGGGMDIGVGQAGFDVLCQVERDPYCCETLRHATASGRHNAVVIENDIRQVEPEELRKALGLKGGELDLLFGGPPCQAFSQIGKRGCLDDERGMLLFEIIRFANAFKPRAIMIEQVRGAVETLSGSQRSRLIA